MATRAAWLIGEVGAECHWCVQHVTATEYYRCNIDPTLLSIIGCKCHRYRRCGMIQYYYILAYY